MGYTLKLMRDTRVREVSKGEITNFGRFNFKFKHPKPISNGLFCQKIFGPIKEYTCDCGITKKVPVSDSYSTHPCKECGIEYLPLLARSNRFGHIELHTHYINPVAYSIVASVLGVSEKALKALSIGKTRASFMAASNGRLIASDMTPYVLILSPEGDINSISELIEKMQELQIDGDISLMENKSHIARAYFKEGFSLYDFFNTTILVTPPSSRDLMKVGDRIGYAEVNVLYTRLIRESLRVQAIKQESEEVISKTDKSEMIKMESLIIQKLVNMLYLEGANYGKIDIPPIMANLKGKAGIIRGNLLGKRVDFSGRSVITSGPHLPVDTVGLPVDMLYELMKPYIIHELMKIMTSENNNRSSVAIIKSAVSEHSHKTERVIQIIEKLSKSMMVMMNRAPSLHRYSVMTFKIKPHFDQCIYFPPLACSPFNADFDGDTLGVHLLLTEEVYEETKITSFENNLMSSAAVNTPNASPAHEMIVGAYLLSNTLGV